MIDSDIPLEKGKLLYPLQMKSKECPSKKRNERTGQSLINLNHVTNSCLRVCIVIIILQMKN